MWEWLKRLLGIKCRNSGFPPLSSHHMQKVQQFAASPTHGKILVVGDSHAEFWEAHSQLLKFPIVGRGIGGDLTTGVLDILPFLKDEQPTDVILSIGSNNLGWDSPESNAFIIPHLVTVIVQLLSVKNCRVFMHPLLPVCRELVPSLVGGRTADKLSQINADIFKLYLALKDIVGDRVVFINHAESVSQDYNMIQSLTFDGAHMNASGYALWANLLNRYF